MQPCIARCCHLLVTVGTSVFYLHLPVVTTRWQQTTAVVINAIFLSLILKLKSQNTLMKYSGGDIKLLHTNTLDCVAFG